MKTLVYIITLISLWAASFLPLVAQPNGQDSTAIQPAYPDSLRVTVDPGVFSWGKVSYIADVRFLTISPVEDEANGPDSLMVFIDLETKGATFWAASNNEGGKFVKTDYIVLRKNRPLAKGQVRWLSGNPVILTAKLNDIKVTKEATVFIPMLLLILCLTGGAIGGWLRFAWIPKPTTKTSRSHPNKWQKLLEPLKEIAVGMVAGVLLYLLNMISPLYLEFRPILGAGWLGLVQPLVVGFIGGWGGISLLVNLLQWISKDKVAPAAVEAGSAAKGRGK